MTFHPLRFIGVFIATLVGLAVLIWAVDHFFGFDVSSGAVGVIPIMIAATVEGQKHAQATRDPIPRIWYQAALMMAIALGLNLVLGAIYLGVDPVMRDFVISMPAAMVIGLVIIAFVFWLVARGFYAMGAKNIWRAQDKA